MGLPNFSEALRIGREKAPAIRAEEERRQQEAAFQRRIAGAPSPKAAKAIQEADRQRRQQVEKLHTLVTRAMRECIQPELNLVTMDLQKTYTAKRSPLSPNSPGVSARRVARAERWLQRKAIPAWHMHETHVIPGSQKGEPMDWTTDTPRKLALGTDGVIYAAHTDIRQDGLINATPVNFGKTEGHEFAMDVGLGLIYQGLANLVAVHELAVSEHDL